MAVTIVMTGTARSCTLTSGSNSMVVSSATGLVVGATIQGTGVPTGSRIGSISGTTVTMVTAAGAASNATVGGAQNLIFSSVYGSTLTISMSGATDYATPQNIYDAGFGVMSDNIAKREILFPGGLTVTWSNIVAGAVFDFLNWTLEFGVGGRWQFEGATILGELRGGYLVNGTQFMKTAGPTFYSNSWNNGGAGGSNMWTGTATGAMTGKFRMHNVRFVEYAGSNASFYFAAGRMEMIVENMILDHQGDSAGANASIGAAYGTLKNTYMVKTNGGISQTNGSNYATFDGLYYVGNYQSTPQHKFSMPNGFTLDGYAPQVTSSQFLGGFNSATSEIYSNIDLSTAGWGLNDLKTKYQRYGGPITLQFPRTVSFEFNDSTAANLTGVTLYIKSGSTALVNAVQAGDYSAATQALNLVWTTSINVYRVCDSFVDTIAQVAQVRKYGYIEQSTSYSLNLAKYSQPFFMLTDSALVGINEATAAAITTAGINWATKTITPTADLSYDQINARIAYELAQTTNSAQADPRTVVGSNLTLATGWTLVVNTGRTISTGTAITYLYCPTVTLNGSGKITAVYATTAGTSTILELRNVKNGAAYIAAYNSDKTTILFGTNATGSAQTYTTYYPPGSTGTAVYVARQGYGDQFEFEVITLVAGAMFYSFTDIPDEGISESSLATVNAYTTIETTNKLYDRVAAFRMTEPGIKLGNIVVRAGTQLQFGSYSGVVNQSAAAVFNIVGSTITLKANALAGTTKYDTIIATPPATWTANTNEGMNVDIEDANGDSSISILGAIAPFSVYKFPITLAYPSGSSDDRLDPAYLVATVTDRKYRFINDPDYNFFVWSAAKRSGDNAPNLVEGQTAFEPMEKGNYTASCFQGAEIQVVEAPEITEINNKVDSMQIDITNMPTSVWGHIIETGHSALATMRLMASVLVGKVSGAGTGTETFRDLNDTKDRVISSVDENGNRTAVTKDGT